MVHSETVKRAELVAWLDDIRQICRRCTGGWIAHESGRAVWGTNTGVMGSNSTGDTHVCVCFPC
jgi:hypothetical protein